MMNKDERGVSPVVGAILLIAITVIVAGTISVFVLGVGTPEKQPTANIGFSGLEDNTDSFTIEHRGGDSIPYSEMTVYQGENNLSVFTDDNNFFEVPNTMEVTSLTSTLSTGQQITIVHDPSDSIIAQATV